MLKDRYFYPLAIVFIVAIISYALSQGEHENLTMKIILEDGYIVDSEHLKKLTASPGTSYEYVAETSSEKAYIILKSNIARADAPASAGVFAALGPKFEEAFAERNLRIIIRARQGHKDPLKEFDMGYFTADVGDSGWKRKELTSEWQDYRIEFKPKAPVSDSGIDYLGVWPGQDGTQKTMEIQSMKVDVIPTLRR